MFDNIGRKIKNLAELVTWLGITCSVVVGFVVCCIDEHMILPGFMIMILGGLASWLSSLLFYAFGQQVESTENIEKMLKKMPASQKMKPNSDDKRASTVVCPKCSFEQPAAAKFCCRCGAEIKKD